ncbi:MAG: NAD(P)H-binding protein [Fimbriimonas sp.]|nr:NAD(P)H-binding protein [Fimbriimonas sp.]
MSDSPLHVVTGAFGYTGRYIASRLLDSGIRVRTVTNSPDRANPFAGRVEAYPFHFDEPRLLADSLRGADVLYNTYWVRFNTVDFQHSVAVENSLKLFEAAKQAGIRRVVHVSITNPSESSRLEYFNGKARLEKALMQSGLAYAILRPTVIFGLEDILVNNIAWTLRRLPIFGVFGDGSYSLQPIYVDDMAKLAIEQGSGSENAIVDAIGPETFTYRELVETIGRLIGKPRKIVSVPPALGYAIGCIIGKLVGDVMITREEIEGLMQGLLLTDSPSAGETMLSEWVAQHSNQIGRRYAGEVRRRKDRKSAYPAMG